jgi:cellulose synthase/poly-beta-1,6-N-acetylglucosamine synthase-like glycosyltransferase
VELIYLTCNDFEPSALLKSKQQDYPNFQVVICDDSTNPDIIQAIDRFQVSYPNIQIIRRETNKGFKAGNLNNYLQHSSAAYYVILDSDEVIPSNFIVSCLRYFASSPDIGIVQANHIVATYGNKFVKTFARGVESHWATYQTMKNTYGFLSFLGHGAMLSAQCYRAADGFPEVVAEDLCFSIRAREKGFYTVFAPEIVCEEDYPISYLAFKKRHNKWTQGNM